MTMKSSLFEALATQLMFILILISTSCQYSLATSYIKKCCTTTTYPKLCYTTLSPYSSQIKTSPKLLATKALTVAHTTAQSASHTMGRLSLIRGLRPMESAALSDCTAAVGNSAAQLHRAIGKMAGRTARKEAAEMVVNDVQTWTSTALTFAGTCLDGFSGGDTDGNVKVIVRREILKLSQVISNALALVNGYASSRKAHHLNP